MSKLSPERQLLQRLVESQDSRLGLADRVIGADRIADEARALLAQPEREPQDDRPVIPDSYMLGHKHALEWAADMAEAEHPLTSDWLYDDPHKLADEIRKGPDMSFAQPERPQWTDTPPELPGYYWYRPEEGWPANLCDVIKLAKEECPSVHWITGLSQSIESLDGQWCGPIAPPEE